MAQQPSSNVDAVPAPLIYAAILLVILVVLWLEFHAYISLIMFLPARIELSILSYLSQDPVIHKAKDYVFNTPAFNIDFVSFKNILSFTGSYTRYLWVLILCFLSYKLFKAEIIGKFNKTLSLDDLVDVTSSAYPHASIFRKRNMKKINPPGVMDGSALKPRELLKREGLLVNGKEIDREKADKYFGQTQLGLRFVSIEAWRKSPSHHYKLTVAVMFMLRLNGLKEEYIELRNNLAKTFNKTGRINDCIPKVIEIYDFLCKKENVKYTIPMTSSLMKKSHAYEYTAMTFLFAISKKGVFPPSDFRWVKQYNRTFWYSMHQVTSRVAWAEAAAVRAHYLAEVAVGLEILMKNGFERDHFAVPPGKALAEPMIKEVYEGFEFNLREIKPREGSIYDEILKEDNH